MVPLWFPLAMVFHHRIRKVTKQWLTDFLTDNIYNRISIVTLHGIRTGWVWPLSRQVHVLGVLSLAWWFWDGEIFWRWGLVRKTCQLVSGNSPQKKELLLSSKAESALQKQVGSHDRETSCVVGLFCLTHPLVTSYDTDWWQRHAVWTPQSPGSWVHFLYTLHHYFLLEKQERV